MRAVTMADVALHAGVSKSTVSQYLNHRYDYMGEQTKERVAAAIQELGYKPNMLARSLKRKNSTTIGVIVANISHEFSTQIIQSIEKYCNELDYHIIVCNAEDDPVKEKKYIEMLKAKQVDGIAIFPTSTNVEIYKVLKEESYPMIFIDRDVVDAGISSVMLNNQKASQLAVEEFIQNGYSRMGIITTSTINNVTPRVERMEGFRKAMKVAGLPVDEQLIRGVEINQIQSELHRMMHLEEPPDALLAGNDLALIEILKYVKANQLNIPKDLAVIGIDDVSFASFYNPELSTIVQPTQDMGRQAAKLVIDQIVEQKLPEESIYRFEPTLKRRQSY
ncbi:LacI family DNA-binding transcriptional regulator [Halalkalibacillus halophilus]|uniref:LacI family DNA-binding transcriptional regulator n=1 Tax=Halalkalibacillus halophilus TaxID=392827 RepID=UPI0004895DF8|nr:LacI family DNA-binding transcriptional regulator [Halalkalibacillus halophilus]